MTTPLRLRTFAAGLSLALLASVQAAAQTPKLLVSDHVSLYAVAAIENPITGKIKSDVKQFDGPTPHSGEIRIDTDVSPVGPEWYGPTNSHAGSWVQFAQQDGSLYYGGHNNSHYVDTNPWVTRNFGTIDLRSTFRVQGTGVTLGVVVGGAPEPKHLTWSLFDVTTGAQVAFGHGRDDFFGGDPDVNLIDGHIYMLRIGFIGRRTADILFNVVTNAQAVRID